MDLTTHQTHEFTGDTVICNIDPKSRQDDRGRTVLQNSATETQL